MKYLNTLALLTGWLLTALPQAHAAGDAVRGAKTFDEECAECHSLKEGKNKKGPSLYAILGRKSAGIADFNYSDAMRAYNETWTAQAIDAYIKAPKKVVPGGKMKYEGLTDEAARQDILAFLASQH